LASVEEVGAQGGEEFAKEFAALGALDALLEIQVVEIESVSLPALWQ